MGAVEDWQRTLQDQVDALEKWAQEHPLEAGLVIVVVASLGLVAVSKAYDTWLKG